MSSYSCTTKMGTLNRFKWAESSLISQISLGTCTCDKFLTRRNFLFFVAAQCCIWREMRCWNYTVQWFNKLDLGKLIILAAHSAWTYKSKTSRLHFSTLLRKLSLWTSSFRPCPSYLYNLVILKLMIFTPWTEPEIYSKDSEKFKKLYTEYHSWLSQY